MAQFWLKVKKEYIFDNYNEMYEYLRNGLTAADTANYDETVDCVFEIADDIGRSIRESAFYEMPRPVLDRTVTDLTRLLAMAVLAGFRRSRPANGALLTLVSYLMYQNGEVHSDALARLWRVALSAMRGDRLSSPGFSWSDIEPQNFSLSVFVHKLAQARFVPAGNDVVCIENHGLMLIRPDLSVSFAAVNRDRYQRSSLGTIFASEGIASLLGANDERPDDRSFDEILAEARTFYNEMATVSQSPVHRLKDYSRGEEFLVRIVERSGVKVVGETVDPAYTRLNGKMQVMWPGNYHPGSVAQQLNAGDIVFARLAQPGSAFVFDMSQSLEDYYRAYAASFAGEYVPAIFVSRNPQGSLWVTVDGVRVFVHKDIEDKLNPEQLDAFDRAISSGTPLMLQFYRDAPDTKRTPFRIYAMLPDKVAYDDIPLFSIADADRAFVRVMCDEAAEEYRDMPRAAVEMTVLPVDLADTAANVLYRLAHADNLTPVERLKRLTLALVAAIVSDRNDSARLLEFEINALDRKVAFAHNREVRPLTVPAALSGIDSVIADSKMVEALGRYRNPAVYHAVHASTGESLERVETLIKASNSLVDIIGGVELNNIKMAVARSVGVDEEFEPIISDRTFYGSEGLTLEFKKSIVFPPVNRRRSPEKAVDPELQKWAILKTVCGFLNSRSGGELLLGVNDHGYADGVDADMEALQAARLIPEANIDQYRLYVQNVIDRAFCESDSTSLPTDIVTLNVSYLPETNAEGKTILRIRVRPYQYGVVDFVPGEPRPAGYASSYVRRDGSTKPLTPALRAEIVKYKAIAMDSSTQRILAVDKAITERNIITVKDYTSPDGVSDITFEPYRIWKKRGLVYGCIPDTRTPILIRLSRVADVIVSERKWSAPKCSLNVNIDIFGCLVEASNSHTVNIRLTDFGRVLLLEEAGDVRLTKLNTHDDFRWQLTLTTSDSSGYLRFVRSVPEHAKIV